MTFKAAFTLILFSISQLAYSEPFLEGKHYSIVDTDPISTERHVIEYFSFSCPACFAIEPHIAALEDKRPEIEVQRVHVPFGGRQAKLSQKAFVLLELLGLQKHHDAIFRRIHSEKNPFNNEDELVSYFEQLGHNDITIRETLRSFTANMRIKQMNVATENNTIRQIPSLIVNGKYKISNRAVYDGVDLAKLIAYLNAITDDKSS